MLRAIFVFRKRGEHNFLHNGGADIILDYYRTPKGAFYVFKTTKAKSIATISSD